jgi:cobalt-zinc-cadmium efflux system outer membrane protein
MPVGHGVARRRVRRAIVLCALTCVPVVAFALPLLAQEPVPKRPLGSGLPVYMPAPGDTERREPATENPTGTLALADALTLALLQNPTLGVFGWEVRAREARALQAARRRNPEATALVEDYGARRFADGGVNEPVQPQGTLQLSQVIELGGKRAARAHLATLDRDLAAWDYETARIEVLTEVSRAFTDVLAAQAMVAQAEETTRLVDQVRQSVAQRVAAGDVSPIEETRAAVALGSTRVELARARRRLEAQRTRLALLWGSARAAFTRVEGELSTVEVTLPPFDSVIGQLQQNPELARWATEYAHREAAIVAERSKGVPDVAVTAGYRRYTGVDANALVAGATVSLPFFDKNRDGVREAQSRAARAREEERAAQTRVGAALAEAYATLAATVDEVTLLRADVLPAAAQAFEAISEGYRLGRFGLVDVLEAQRTLVAATTQHVTALSNYLKAVAGIERLIGAPLTGAAAPRP